jgi:hypothetical protein
LRISSATSPLISVEFCQASGSLRVVETTYLGRLFSVAANGSSAGW